jgi:hypothetical protein
MTGRGGTLPVSGAIQPAHAQYARIRRYQDHAQRNVWVVLEICIKSAGLAQSVSLTAWTKAVSSL